MPTILAHRGNTRGPSRLENRGPTLSTALRQGWGVEIDLRRTPDGRFYLSHDPAPVWDDQLAEPFFADVRRHPDATVAVNVKESGYEQALVDFLGAQRVLNQVFLFDMELVEQTPGETSRLLRSLDPQIKLAARVSDRNEPIEQALGIREASIVWLDEFDGPWVTAEVVRRLKEAGRVVHAVSPELHGFSVAAARVRWDELTRWGVDGICTDYPEDLARCLASDRREAVA